MKKNAIILFLAFIGLAGFGQTPPDSVWYQGYIVDGSDTLAKDSASGAGISKLKLANVNTSEINLGIISGKTTINGQSWKSFFPDPNYADTAFYLIEERSINADSTLNLPKRISKIYLFNSALTGSDTTYYRTVFNIPQQPSSSFIVPDNYATIALAITAASVGDTIQIKKGTYASPGIVTKENITLQGLDRVIVTGANTIYFNAAKATINNIETQNAGINFRFEFAGYTNITVNNCIMSNANGAVFYRSANTQGKATINNSDVTGYIQWNADSLYVYDSYFKSNIYAARPYKIAHINYCTIEKMTNGATLPTATLTDLNYTGCNINGKVIFNTPLSNDYSINVRHSNLTENAGIRVFDFNSQTGNIPLNIYNTDIIRGNYSTITNYFIYQPNPYNITLRKVSLDSTGGYFISAADGDGSSFIIDSCSFDPDSNIIITATNFINTITNDTLNNCFLSFINNDVSRVLNFSDNYCVNSDSMLYDFRSTRALLSGNYIKFSNKGFINLQQNLNIPDSIPIYNNEFDFNTTNETTFLSLSAGSDSVDGGFKVYNNKFTMPRYYGNTQDVHMFLNYGNSMSFHHNKVIGSTTTCVSKDVDSVGLEFEYYGNIFIDCEVPIYVRSAPKTKIYNNTVINNNYALNYFVFIDDNQSVSYGTASDSCEIYNNIVDDNIGTGKFIYFGKTTDTVGVKSDNNIVNGSTGIFWGYDLHSTTFATWQGLGYDANSYNTDPNLNANGVPNTGSIVIGKGLNLGAPYNYGLYPNTSFPNPTLRIQRALWSIGAFVPNINTVATSNSKVILFNNRFLKY